MRAIDWDFTGEPGTDGLAGFHWYPARFAEQIPSILVGYLSEPGEAVLDPFCGAGTTLTESFRLNRRPIGIDLNPVAVLMTRAKLCAYSEDALEIFASRVMGGAEAELVSLLARRSDSALRAMVPALDEIQYWFEATTILELAALLGAIEAEPGEHLRTLGRACFSSILRACSSQEKHWGYICDNVRPRSLTHKNAFRHFGRALRQFIEQYRRFRKLSSSQRQGGQIAVRAEDVVILEGDAATELANVTPASVQLIVTSPPYLSVTDYMDSQRLSLLWLCPRVSPNLRSQEIGARYKRFRKDPLTPYLCNMKTCLDQMARVLEVGRYCCLILAESPSHAQYVAQVVELLIESGFTVVTQLARHIAKKRSLSPRIFNEVIVIARKDRDG